MNPTILEKITLPGLFIGIREIARHNHRVITDIAWRSRMQNTMHPISVEPQTGGYPNSFRFRIALPMYVSHYDIDYGWNAVINVTYTREYFDNIQGSGHVIVRSSFSSAPFHHHATGVGSNSSICVGNLPDVARLGKACNLIPMICALLNRDQMVCSMKGGHLNSEAYEHWRDLDFRSTTQISFFGADGNPITPNGQPNPIRFQKI